LGSNYLTENDDNSSKSTNEKAQRDITIELPVCLTFRLNEDESSALHSSHLTQGKQVKDAAEELSVYLFICDYQSVDNLVFCCSRSTKAY
jgi:hypothetical protein